MHFILSCLEGVYTNGIGWYASEVRPESKIHGIKVMIKILW